MMRTISRTQYHQLVGLLTLASQHDQKVREVQTAALELLGIREGSNESDHVTEAIFEGRPAEQLLERLGIPLVFNDGLWEPSGSVRRDASGLPDPTPEMLESPAFEAVWQRIKDWDIAVAPGGGYSGATGSHVRAILDALAGAGEPTETAPAPTGSSRVPLELPESARLADAGGADMGPAIFGEPNAGGPVDSP